MENELEGIPTTKSQEKQLDDNMVTLKKSVSEAVRVQTAKFQRRIDALEAGQMKSSIPPNFLGPLEPFVKCFDEHLEEESVRGNMTFEQAYDRHMELAYESLQKTSIHGLRPNMEGMAKSITQRKETTVGGNAHREPYDALQKSFTDSSPEAYEEMAKSILGQPGDPGAPGAWYNFLEENLSRYIQRIMLSNEDATALQSIPTAITSNIVPEVAQLKTYGVGYGKHTMGFKEGATPLFGGGQLMDRLTNTLVQRGIRASVTEMLLANRQKLVDRNPLALERELRVLEFNLGKNHGLLYGDSNINKDGSTILEVAGFVEQISDADTGYPDHIKDWDGTAFDATTNNPLNIFRDVAENLIINGHLPGGVITGKYSVLMDYGVANSISTVVDEKQRIMIEKYEQAAQMYGQAFSGFVTDLGTFRFKRSKTLHLTANDTWTLDDDVSPNAIIWPHAATDVEAIPQSTDGEKEAAGFPNKADLPTGNYQYRVSVVNDQGESNVSDALVTTTDGSTPHPVDTAESVEITIPYDAAFAGGVVSGETVSPARYFLLYRSNTGETTDKEMSCIAKIPINGTSATTYVDWNQKIPKTTDMFFICNNPLDISHCSLTPAFEIPLYDILKGSTRQWMMMDIAGLCMWAPQRQFLYRNVPGFVSPV